MKIDPNAPAYPHLAAHCQRVNESEHYEGIPIRLEIAARAMQGLLAAEIEIEEMNKMASALGVTQFQEVVARIALIHADALIAAFNAGEDK